MDNEKIITIEGLKKHFPMGSGNSLLSTGSISLLERGVCRHHRSERIRKDNPSEYYRFA